MKTLIAVPCMDQVPAQFAQSLAMLEKVDECAVCFQVGSLIYTSRNELARKAVQIGADQVLWLDSDMMFPPDTLKKLIKGKEKGDIVSGLYFRRVAPFTPVVFEKLTIGDKCEWTNLEQIPDEIFEAEGVGFGCVLTPTEVFLDVVSQFNGMMFAPIGNVGEDLSFCWRARQCGYKIVVDPSIQLGHVGHTVINREFYEQFTAVRSETRR